MKIWKEINKPLLVPRELMDEIVGNRGRKISVIVTKSNQIIITRRPDNHQTIYRVEIGKRDDFVPTAILKVAKIDHNSEFKIAISDGDLVVTGIPLIELDEAEQDILKPRILDL